MLNKVRPRPWQQNMHTPPPRPVLLMRRILDETPAPPRWPAGVTLAGFSAESACAVHHLMAIAYAQGGGMIGTFDAWWDALIADTEFDPALCFIAKNAEAAIVGVAQCWTSAFVKDLAVHPAWRRRGIGEALMLQIFAAFKARGAKSVALKVLIDNPSGALRLYRRLGMQADSA